MLTTRWQPIAEMNRLRNEMDRLFSQYGNSSAPRSVGAFLLLNMLEDDESLSIEAELPGFEMYDLEIYVTGGNQLSIAGERKQPLQDEGAWHRQERAFGKFRRSLELPFDVDSDKVSAVFKHGVLTLVMPKREEVKPRRIQVKAK